MRNTGSVALPLAVAALSYTTSAFVLPNVNQEDRPFALPQADGVSDFLKTVPDKLSAAFDKVSEKFHQAEESLDSWADDTADALLAGGHGHKKKEFPHLTIYQAIQHCDYTQKFAKFVDDYPNVVEILNSTDAANHTLFVPVDSAFEHIPDDHEKPDKKVIEQALLYHIGLGDYPAVKLLKTHTVPTLLEEKYLDGEEQRLRTQVGLGGLKLNFYSRVVSADFKLNNGIIHAVNHILVPPPMVGRLLTLFPGQFSTLLLAYEKTDFVKYIHDLTFLGTTVFAPSNSAFQRLGPRANAFLFNSDKGLKYLKAILKYHIVANATLYTDAFYDKTHDQSVDSTGREHFDLETLLHDTHVSVDIAEWYGFQVVKVNGFANVSVRDGIAKNGVIHVIDKVLIPPHKHHDKEDATDEDFTDDISVPDLIQRLDPYVDGSAVPAETELGPEL